MSSRMALNVERSSARSIITGFVPRILTPRVCSGKAKLLGIWPPVEIMMPLLAWKHSKLHRLLLKWCQFYVKSSHKTSHSSPMQTRFGSQIARFMGPTWDHLRPVGPRWAPWIRGVFCKFNSNLCSASVTAVLKAISYRWVSARKT